MGKIVFFNGKFIRADQALVSALVPGFLYGWGVFETMRAYRSKIIYLEAHLKRLQQAAKVAALKLPYSVAKIKGLIKKTVKLNGFPDAAIRLTLWKSERASELSISVERYQPPLAQGYRAAVCQFKMQSHPPHLRIKSTNYLFYALAYQEARKRKFDEAIITNERGYLSEGSRTNIFFAQNNCLYTPALECGALAGITRKVVLDLARKNKLAVAEGNFTLPDLYAAGEAFLTNSLLGIMPLVFVESHKIGQGKAGPLTRFFRQKYNTLSKNEI